MSSTNETGGLDQTSDAPVNAGGTWAPRLTADEALSLLTAGNRRYVTESMSGPRRTAARRLEVSPQQHPFAAMHP